MHSPEDDGVPASAPTRGYLIPIGGAVRKRRQPVILQRFVELSGGDDARIAVIPVGYADGIPRAMTNKGEVLINGARFPMVGTVTMDQTMIHIGDTKVRVGDEVLLWGESASGTLELLDLAESINTIPYELTCGVSSRVQRIYIDHPKYIPS